jgi:1,3-beta-glucan synthase
MFTLINIGIGLHAISQPGRELLCKITELGMFSADFVLGHFLLFIQLPALCTPYIDKLHSTMLFWLRPSRQIRPPIYSSKQSKLRKKRVMRFSVIYFLLLVVFLALTVGPVVASTFSSNSWLQYHTNFFAEKIIIDSTASLTKDPVAGLNLFQPYEGKWNNTDTAYWEEHEEELNDGAKERADGVLPHGSPDAMI